MTIFTMYLNNTYLIKVEHKIQFTYIVKVFIQHFYKVVYSFQIAQVVVVHIHAYAEVQASVPSVYYLEIPELKICKITAIYYYPLSTSVYRINIIQFETCTSTKLVCLASRTVTTAWTSSMSFCFSSSSKFMYHFASRVLPARFCIKMKRI